MEKKRLRHRHNFTLEKDVVAEFKRACGLASMSGTIEKLMQLYVDAGGPKIEEFDAKVRHALHLKKHYEVGPEEHIKASKGHGHGRGHNAPDT